MSDNDNIILVTGCQWSGTTWTGTILSRDPSIGYIEEPFNPGTAWMPSLPTEFYPYIAPENRETSKLASEYKKVINFGYNPSGRILNGETTKLRDFPASVYYSLKHLNNRVKKKRPLVKDPISLLSAKWLQNLFNHDTIVLVRHPAAFVESSLRRHKRKGNSYMKALFDIRSCKRYLRTLPEEIKNKIKKVKRSDGLPKQSCVLWVCLNYEAIQLSNNPNTHIVRHEDLVDSPTEQFKRLYNLLGLNRQSIEGVYDETDEDTTTKWKSRLEKNTIKYISGHTKYVAKKIYPSFYE